MNCFMLKLALPLILLAAHVIGQQQYSGSSAFDCNATANNTPPASLLYTCNGEHRTCTAFLIFTAQFPYNTVVSIAALTSSDQAEVAKINNVTCVAVFAEGQEVIVPVNCSCSGEYYQACTTYEVQPSSETYYTIANDTFQGLSTCNALMHANTNHSATGLQPGDELRVPLRCACPTREQVAAGTKILMTYTITVGDTLYLISKRFNVNMTTVSEANNLFGELSIIYPFTTILIPLQSEPLRSHAVSHGPDRGIPSPPPAPIVPRKLKRVPFAAGVAVGAISLAIILLLILLVFLLCSRQNRVLQTRGTSTKPMSSHQDLIREIARLDHSLKVFKFSEIKKATQNFATKNRIGCNMYHGILRNQIVAVQKNSRDAHNEVRMLQQINHFNIVELYGFCEHKDDLYLVYEHMENGSLQGWLGIRAAEDPNGWNHMLRIALDVADGLLYLHKFTNPAHVHNNISSSNILLDGNLRAKIANFSLARTANCNYITRLVTAKGYIAPESLGAGPANPKADVFAFGIVLLELITGKGPVFLQDGQERLLSTMAADIMESPNAAKELSCFIEPGLSEDGGMEHAIHIAKLSLSCLAQDPADRPEMVEVVSILQKLQFNMQKPVYISSNMKAMSMENEEDTFSSSSVFSSLGM